MGISVRQEALATIYLDGDKEIMAKLKALCSKDFANAVASGVRKAEKVVLKAAQAGASGIGKHGDVSKSLIQKSKAQGASGGYISIVGADSKYKAHRPTEAGQMRAEYMNIGKILHLVERGTKPHEIMPRNKYNPSGWNKFRRAHGKTDESKETQTHLLAVPMGGGRYLYVTRVSHPGAAPHPFLVEAQEDNAFKVIDVLKKEISRKIESVWGKSNPTQAWRPGPALAAAMKANPIRIDPFYRRRGNS